MARGLDRRALDLTAVALASRVCCVARRGGARARLLRVRPHRLGARWLFFQNRQNAALFVTCGEHVAAIALLF